MKVEMLKKPEEIEKRRPKVNRLILGGFIFLINMSPVYAQVDSGVQGAIIQSMTALLITAMVFIRYGNKSK